METKTKRRVGQPRKPIDEVKRPFSITLYFTDKDLAAIGGREALYKHIREDKAKLQLKYDKLCEG